MFDPLVQNSCSTGNLIGPCCNHYFDQRAKPPEHIPLELGQKVKKSTLLAFIFVYYIYSIIASSFTLRFTSTISGGGPGWRCEGAVGRRIGWCGWLRAGGEAVGRGGGGGGEGGGQVNGPRGFQFRNSGKGNQRILGGPTPSFRGAESGDTGGGELPALVFDKKITAGNSPPPVSERAEIC